MVLYPVVAGTACTAAAVAEAVVAGPELVAEEGTPHHHHRLVVGTCATCFGRGAADGVTACSCSVAAVEYYHHHCMTPRQLPPNHPLTLLYSWPSCSVWALVLGREGVHYKH